MNAVLLVIAVAPARLAPRCDSCGHPGCGGGTDCALRTGLRIMRLAERVRRAA